MQTAKKLSIIPFVLLALVLGVLAGWYRIGWTGIPAGPAGQHGALMVGSFLGTLICLERAVTIKKRAIFIIPLLSGLSVPFFLLDLHVAAVFMLILASAGLTWMFVHFYHKTKELYHIVMMIGAVCWLMGNLLLLLKNLYPIAATWWIGFLFLTIVGERLELTKFLPVTRLKRSALLSATTLFLFGLVLPFHFYGNYFLAAGLILASLWLLKYDMAGKSLRRPGLSRYSGAALLAGYVWLMVAGIFFVKGTLYGFLYDAALHAFFIGFVFSMIFAHAPIILPGIAGVSYKPYHPTLYIWLILLQVSLVVRIIADLAPNTDLRQWGGMFNGVVILAFFVNMAILVLRARKERNKRNFKTP